MEIVKKSVLTDATNYEWLYEELEEQSIFNGYDLPSFYDKRELETRAYEINGRLSKFNDWKRQMLALINEQEDEVLEAFNYTATRRVLVRMYQLTPVGSEDEALAQWAISRLEEEREEMGLLPLKDFIKFEITEEHYLNRKAPNGSKLGKFLKKMGAGKAVLDYDGSHERTQQVKRYGFIINGSEGAIWGMSSLAKSNTWNGWQGTSCQDWRHDNDMSLALLGSVSAYRLYVGQLIELHDGENIEDFNSYQALEDRLIARVNMFHVEQVDVNGEQVPAFVANVLYGNSQTKPILDQVLDTVDDVIIIRD